MPDPFVEMDKEAGGHRDSPLNPTHVEEVFRACLAHGEQSHPTVTVKGILHNAHFAVSELQKRHKEIGAMLDLLPTPFQKLEKGGGGGWSFLQACLDNDGNLWTGVHLTMEQLFMLGLATEQASFCMPREIWEALPGGMPYLVIHTTQTP